MAIRTGCANAGPVGVMNGLFVFLEQIFSHGMARRAELFGIGQFQTPIEPAPKNHAGEKITGIIIRGRARRKVIGDW